jgi:glutamate synthase domain-containing protein 2/glutamate synthase domain-containing protein 1/glutamate synthase domain-containing protein 3
MQKHKHLNQHYPQVQGTLHRPELERDACGVGVVAHIRGERSNEILKSGLTSVCNVVHRGAIDPDHKTGDGAGVLTQLPYKILIPAAAEFGAEVAEKDLGVGVFFLPTGDEAGQTKVKDLAKSILNRRGIGLIGWRKVPINPDELGELPRKTMPEIQQLLVSRGPAMDDDQFERALFMTRREIEQGVKDDVDGLYIASFSHRTISYKGLALPAALIAFYDDLQNPDYETAICLYHQRFSTNTFPSWPLGQPFRMLAHNGEINTLRGNRNWLNSSEKDFQSELWGDDVNLLKEVINPEDSDSASLDSALELFVLSGRSAPHAMAMLVPPAWRIDPETSEEEKAFYQYNRCFQEPWDGPAALVFTDGRTVAATLDRNGLRPARFKLTKDGIFTLGSEVGTAHFDDADVIRKGRLAPGEMISIDIENGTGLQENAELKKNLAARRPYGQWLDEHRLEFSKITDSKPRKPEGDLDILTLTQKQVTFDINKEEMDMILTPMIQKGEELTYSMGDDAALSVLSTLPKALPTYFKQLFAQVTNPPIDSIRERLVMTLNVNLGWQRNLLVETPKHAKVVHLTSPILLDHQVEKLSDLEEQGFPARTIDTTWAAADGEAGLEAAIARICELAEKAADDKIRILILSDRKVDHEHVPVPMLMAVGAVHHHLNRAHKRMWLSIVADTGEVRDTHSAATTFGFGAQALCPYLAVESIREIVENDRNGKLGVDYEQAVNNYVSGLEKGVLKIMSKMGISVLSSYQGAQIFEAIGLNFKVINRCFSGTPSQVEGVGFWELAADCLRRHDTGFGLPDSEADNAKPLKLGDPGYNRFRRGAERHGMPTSVLKNFHTFVKDGDPEKYEKYVEDLKAHHPVALKDLMEIVPNGSPIPISEVEPIEDIRRRFTTAAMSLGALGPEAHETLAIAMNRIGGKSDSGEGGEDPKRFKPYENGDWANSKIKQVASGRFGVNTHYLMNAEELEIKMAQGAKPGEGGQLPGHKVNELIARLRNTKPGVTLISPPPHHDIYSIEDLAQLIHDLKEVNPKARVTVKLVAETGVGTIAAGVVKANADTILISGHDGGTGASPLSSIKHAGLPWELGLAETQQVLMLNNLRHRVTLRTDGGMRNGKDIIMAAILGAEEFNFGTIAMIAMGCVYVRKCHLNTCPVGIATQDPKYRKKFTGKPEHVVNFFNAVAHEVREHMAALGIAKLDDLIGRPEFLKQREIIDHPKANTVDLSRVLKDVAKEAGQQLPRIRQWERNRIEQDPPLDKQIIEDVRGTIEDGVSKVSKSYEIGNTNRNVGTMLSGAIAEKWANDGIPDGTIDIQLTGSAGQSLGTFLCGGVRLTLTGEANDYVGKGMSGGEIIVKAPTERGFECWENSIIGNTVMYGATAGHLFANGHAGERFCVRNSGGVAVVEGTGDHCCEYMTGGLVVILGKTGKNFGAGMSGGLAFAYDEDGHFDIKLNAGMVEVRDLVDQEDIDTVKALIRRHFEYTGSDRAKEILENWDSARAKFRKVQPKADVAVKIEEEKPAAKELATAPI